MLSKEELFIEGTVLNELQELQMVEFLIILVVETYISKESPFHPIMWALETSNMCRTTSCLEFQKHLVSRVRILQRLGTFYNR